MAAYDISWFRGDEDYIDFTLKRGGSALDLTGATVKFTVRVTDYAGAQQFQLTGTQGGATSGVTFPGTFASGECRVTLPDTSMASLTPGSDYVWDVEVTLTDGRVITYPRDSNGDPVVGTLTIVGDPTHT